MNGKNLWDRQDQEDINTLRPAGAKGESEQWNL